MKGSGKTRVLELLEASCAGPMFAVNLSPSALFRRLDKGGATLLLDEADTHLGGSAKSSEKYEDLRALVNAGYRRGAKVYRSEPTGKTVVEREFDVFAPVAVAGIGDLPDTVLDRSIIVPMRRRSRREQVDRYRIRDGKERSLDPLTCSPSSPAPTAVELRRRPARTARRHRGPGRRLLGAARRHRRARRRAVADVGPHAPPSR